MQPSDTFGGARLWWWAVLILFSPLLTAVPPGGHSLHLARARGPTERVSLLGIASEAETSLPVLKNVWKTLESKRTFFSERARVSRSGLKDRLLKKDHGLKDRLLMKDHGLKDRLQMKQYSQNELLLLPSSTAREGHSQVEPLAGQTDSGVVFAAVFCSLIGTVLIVLLLVFGFVVWREAYEVSERKRKLRDPLHLVEESAYAAYPRDDSPSNFPPVFSQSGFGEKGSVPNDVANVTTRPDLLYHPPPVALVHRDHGYRRSRSMLSMSRRHPKKVVRLQVPPASLEPSIGKRYSHYDVTGIELSDAQKRHRVEVSRRVQRY